MPSREEYIALFGDDFDDILRGLNALPMEIRLLLDDTMGKMIYDSEIFAQRINKAIQTQGARGITLSNTAGMLATDMAERGRVFGELRNSIKESLVEGINQSGQAGSFQAYDPEEKTIFTWVTVAGHKICADCSPRGGQRATLKEWEEQGMPATGWSVCGGYCYCILDPSGKISPRVEFEKVQEKGATIKPKPTPSPPVPKPTATPKTGAGIALNKKFTSANKSGNEHFVDAFTDSSEKFKKVLMQFPELRHISQWKKGGYFTEWRSRSFEKYYKGSKDIAYQTRHGGINIKPKVKGTDGYLREYGTIRHEHGHFMHHNIHPNIGKMNLQYQKYYADLKDGIVVSIDDFIAKNRLNKTDADQLKFHEVYFKTRHRIGAGSKYKRTNKAMKETLQESRQMMNELMNIVRLNDKGGKYFTKDHALVKALKLDKNGTHGYIQDLFGALTHNKVGYGHRDSYYKWATMDRHETFANLTAIYSHENPIFWNWLKGTLPEITTYYEELIETILKDGYFGTAMN